MRAGKREKGNFCTGIYDPPPPFTLLFHFPSFPLTFALEDIAAPPLRRVAPAVVAPSSPGSTETAPGALLQICTEEEKKFYNPLSNFFFFFSGRPIWVTCSPSPQLLEQGPQSAHSPQRLLPPLPPLL